MKDLQKNIVPAENQNAKDFYRYGDITKNTGKRILFVGNSITKHAPKPDIGWNNDCGMAATSIDRDYVHLLMSRVNEKCPGSDFAIMQVAYFERNYMTMDIKEFYDPIMDFKPDVVIMFFGANVSKEDEEMENPPKTFGQAYEELRNYLDDISHPIFLHSQGFYIRPGLDAQKQAVAEKYNDLFINIEDIRNREDTHGDFNHPSDLGMEEIANRFWTELEKHI